MLKLIHIVCGSLPSFPLFAPNIVNVNPLNFTHTISRYLDTRLHTYNIFLFLFEERNLIQSTDLNIAVFRVYAILLLLLTQDALLFQDGAAHVPAGLYEN